MQRKLLYSKRMLSAHHPRRHAKSFKYAFEGIMFVTISQANFRVHLLSATLVILLGWMVGLSRVDWLFVVLLISTVLVLEMFNTVFEVLVDHLWQEEHPRAKIIKDVAAGAVLIGSIGALVSGLIIFLPYLTQ